MVHSNAVPWRYFNCYDVELTRGSVCPRMVTMRMKQSVIDEEDFWLARSQMTDFGDGVDNECMWNSHSNDKIYDDNTCG